MLNKFGETLPSIGLRMKTGLTVDFRNRDALRDSAEENAVPLFYAQHIQDGKVVFPVGKEHEYIVTEQSGLRQQNTNYLFVKRFTAKEERRRLQCGVYLARKHPEYAEISTQNKINFICGLRDLSECVVYGLYVLFNSTFYDCYYRILNGSTQVNSTEINAMPVPSMRIIEAMGKELIRIRDIPELIQGAHILPVATIRRMHSIPIETRLEYALDGDNGLWLCENHHKMFDEGMISFDNHGGLLLRNDIDQRHMRFIDETTVYKGLPPEFLTDKFLWYLEQRRLAG